jgi:hypothetical protein
MEETMATSTTAVSTQATASEATRWAQLIFGIICMVMIANLQYGWTLFVNPIDQKHHWGKAAILNIVAAVMALVVLKPMRQRSTT